MPSDPRCGFTDSTVSEGTCLQELRYNDQGPFTDDVFLSGDVPGGDHADPGALPGHDLVQWGRGRGEVLREVDVGWKVPDSPLSTFQNVGTDACWGGSYTTVGSGMTSLLDLLDGLGDWEASAGVSEGLLQHLDRAINMLHCWQGTS